VRGLPLLAAGATLVGVAGVAAAERVGVIAIEGRDAPADRDELARATAAALPDPSLDALATATKNIRAGAVTRARLDRFTQVRAVADQGWQAFLQVQPDAAKTQLQRALVAAEDLLGLDGGLEVYADVSLRLGAVLDYQGDKDGAGIAIRAALAIDPDRELSEREFSPDVLLAVEAARAVSPPTRTVRFTGTTPARTKVAIEVDGVARGDAPVEADLAHGNHVAIARSIGHAPRAIAFAVDATGSTQHVLDLDTDPFAAAAEAGVARDTPDARATAAVEAALLFGEVDAVLVVATTWQRGDPTLLVQRCAGTPVRCTPIQEYGYGSARGLRIALATAIADVSSAAATLAASTLAGDDRLDAEPPTECWTCKPWVIASAGALAVTATVLTIVLLADKPKRLEVTLDTNGVR
jgi:hypothetical protein